MSPQSRLELRLEHGVLQVLAVPGASAEAAKRCLPLSPWLHHLSPTLLIVLSLYLALAKVENTS